MVNDPLIIKSGYTLIELLVGITILSLIFVLGFASFRDFSRRQALVGVGRSLTSDLRLTQEQALAGRKPSDIRCNSPNVLNGYNLQVLSNTYYIIDANCSGGVVRFKDVDLGSPDTGITISTPLPNPLIFKALGQGTNIASGSSVIITLTQTSTGRTQTVTVSSSGEIR